MKTLSLFATVLALASVCPAGHKLWEIRWSDVKNAPWDQRCKVLPADATGPERLVVTNDREEKAEIPILTIGNPCITKPRWALHGKIRYENVQKKGYVNLWNHFPDGGKFYSRTVESHGPMKCLLGSSGWRTMALPSFGSKDPKVRPTKLTVSVVMPSRGTVEIGPLTLMEYDETEDPTAAPDAWWSGAFGGWIGGLDGALAGSAGLLIGMLCWLGRGRRLVLALHVILAGLGAAALVVGLVALWIDQSFGVWYPLVLGGGLNLVLFGGLLPVSRRRFVQLELRRMQAMDAAQIA